MTIERAAEILGGAKGHGEEFYGEVEEACRQGRDALLKRVRKSPFPDATRAFTAAPAAGAVNTCSMRMETTTDIAGTAGRPLIGMRSLTTAACREGGNETGNRN